jgi:hypothetical protein
VYLLLRLFVYQATKFHLTENNFHCYFSIHTPSHSPVNLLSENSRYFSRKLIQLPFTSKPLFQSDTRHNYFCTTIKVQRSGKTTIKIKASTKGLRGSLWKISLIAFLFKFYFFVSRAWKHFFTLNLNKRTFLAKAFLNEKWKFNDCGDNKRDEEKRMLLF